jgi:hypothetical protein
MALAEVLMGLQVVVQMVRIGLQFRFSVADLVAITQPKTCGGGPCESDQNGGVGGQLKLALKAAKKF